MVAHGRAGTVACPYVDSGLRRNDGLGSKEVSVRGRTGGIGGVPQPFSNSPKFGGYRGLENKSTYMLLSEQGSPEGSLSGGVIGVSPKS